MSFSSNIGKTTIVQKKMMIVQERTKDDNNHVSEYVLIFILGVRVP